MTGTPWNQDASFPVPDRSSGEVEVAVLGAGPAALAAARTMAAAGARVSLVAPGPWTAGPATTGPGVALPCLPGHYADLARVVGREQARSLWALAGAGASSLRSLLAGEDCALRRGGVLLLAADEEEHQEMAGSLRMLVEDGFSPRMMGPPAATNYLPVEAEFGALYLGGAATFDPVRALARLAGLAEASGVRFVSLGSSCTWREEGGSLLLEGSSARLRAGTLVLAEGAPREGLEPWLPALAGLLLATDPLREGMTDVTVAASANRGRELYQGTPGGGLVGFGLVSGQPGGPSAEDLLEAGMQARFPETRRAGRTHREPTLHEGSADGLPLVGPLPGHDRVHLLAGFGTSAWSLGHGAGEALARRLGGGAGEELVGLEPGRFPVGEAR